MKAHHIPEHSQVLVQKRTKRKTLFCLFLLELHLVVLRYYYWLYVQKLLLEGLGGGI